MPKQRILNASDYAVLSSREWRTMIDALYDGVCLLDPDGVIRRVNRAMCRVSGRSMDELLGAACRDLLGPGAEVLDSLIATNRFQTVVLDIGERTFEVGFNPVPGEADEANGAVCTFRDITEIVRAHREREELLARERLLREESEAASRAKDDFLAVVAHDLRGPLQGIVIAAQLFEEDRMDSARRLKAIESLDRNAKAQQRLIEDLVDYSAIMKGRMTLAVSPTDLRAVIRMTIETVQPSADEKKIALETNLGAGPTPVRGDPGRLQQVFWNILFNAVKFTPPGGHIRITLHQDSDRARVEVTDDGEGIPADVLPLIFKPFRQGKKTSGGRTGGLGLGLSIARHLVELHGGTLEAESAGAGQGATFILSLPLRP